MDTKIHLEAGNLGETIKEENSASYPDWAKAMIFIHHHIDEGLKSEYLTVEDPLAIWKDFKLVAEYNSAMFRINSQITLCGETITEQAEQNNELLMKNHQSRPTGSAPFPEMNDASLEVKATSSGGNNHKKERGYKRGRWNRKGKNHGVQFHN
ncbi:uncharacterized protein [Pyrus communis]|uniref:uncharacterized protein n=1 Tax=Pyrus communis TaxID=23211 RepID=UPI0035C19E68